jgi:5'-nucleotidase
MEGTILGIPSVSMSQEYGVESRQRPHWATALRYGPEIIRNVLATGMPRATLVNVNFPDCPPEAVKGIAVTRQGARNLDLLRIDERRDGRGNPYYWIAFMRGVRSEPGAADTDLAALSAGYVSVTPLRLDLTDMAFAEKLATAFK